jgi:hypothetical protein
MKLKATLTRKFGPFPAWVWLAGLAAAMLLYRSYMGRGTAAATDTSSTGIADVGAGVGAFDTGGVGGGGSVGSGSLPLDQAAPVGGELFPDNKLRMATMDLVDQLRNATDTIGSATYDTAPFDASGDTGRAQDGPRVTVATGRPAGTGGGSITSTKVHRIAALPSTAAGRARGARLMRFGRQQAATAQARARSAAFVTALAHAATRGSTSGRETTRPVASVAAPAATKRIVATTASATQRAPAASPPFSRRQL